MLDEHRRFAALLVAFVSLLVVMVGCNTSAFLQPAQAPTPAATRTPQPTFTPSPESIQGLIIVITPPQDSTPGVIIVPPNVDPRSVLPLTPAAQPGVASGAEAATPGTPTETPTITPTPTETPTFTPTPSATPTPFVVVENGLIGLRIGPGVEYPLFAQLGPDIPIAITGRNTEGDWLRICCVNSNQVWVAASHVRVQNDLSAVQLILADPPPSPTPTFTPTDTATPTSTPTATRYPFEVAVGPQFFPVDDVNTAELLTIWVKLFVGSLQTSSGCIEPPTPQPANKEAPADGYYLKVTFDSFDRPATNDIKPSSGGAYFNCSAPSGAGNRVEFNYKYEYRVPDTNSSAFKEQWFSVNPTTVALPRRCDLFGTGTWTMYVVDGGGNQLSDPVSFQTSGCNNRNLEIYIAWVRTR